MRLEISRSRDLPKPNIYVGMLDNEYAQWAFNEEKATAFKGAWRTKAFASSNDKPLDLEIGTGNGYFFAHYASQNPQRLLLGIELKFKPLIQSIRRALKAKCNNARIARYDASFVGDLFAEGELDNVIIHFPDPWEKKRKHKNRLIEDEFLKTLFKLQKPGSIIDFKTDSQAYFDWSVERFERSPYKIQALTRDLHKSELSASNYITHFESIFLKQGLPIYAARLERI